MITQGFANELYHISNFFNCEVKCDLEYLSKKITCSVFGRYISVNYNGELIWRECLDSYRDWETDRKSTRLNSSHLKLSRMPSSA